MDAARLAWHPTYRADGRRSGGLCFLDGAWRAEIVAPSVSLWPERGVAWLVEHKHRELARGVSSSVEDAKADALSAIGSLRSARGRPRTRSRCVSRQARDAADRFASCNRIGPNGAEAAPV
ncbi:hypothetical protein [Azospirillum brasilense]|uniref:hypothetical protein n=1 Tax=Azospirillum brasilense TaxID=192 RepID=UPI0011EBA4BD|nr:hypothetical protein [Azospirillum brasilense]